MDYPNMSYCAAENTLRAVNQLVELINEGQKNFEEPDGYEWRAIHSLCKASAELAKACEKKVAYYKANNKFYKEQKKSPQKEPIKDIVKADEEDGFFDVLDNTLHNKLEDQEWSESNGLYKGLNEIKSIKLTNKFIEECKSGEIIYFVSDQLDSYKNFFQFIDPDIENQYGDSFADWPNQDPPWGDEVPGELLKDRKIYYSSFTYERSIEVYKAKSIREEYLKEFLKEEPFDNLEDWIYDLGGLDCLFKEYENGCTYLSYDEHIARNDHHVAFCPDNTLQLLKNVYNKEDLKNIVKDSIIVANQYSDISPNGYVNFYIVYKDGEIKELELS